PASRKISSQFVVELELVKLELPLVCPWLLTVTATGPVGRSVGTTTTTWVPEGFTLITSTLMFPNRIKLSSAVGSKPLPVMMTSVPGSAFDGSIEMIVGGGFVGALATTKNGAVSIAVAWYLPSIPSNSAL